MAVSGMIYPLAKLKPRISRRSNVPRSGFPPAEPLRRHRSSVYARAWALLGGAALLLLGANTSYAHDPYVSTTDIWLRPDNCEVDIAMNRTLYRQLLDVRPAAALTDDNFDGIYRPLLANCAPSMLEITVDGAKLQPRAVEVSLQGETDLQFTFIYERPRGAKLRLSALFVKKMDVGFMNSLVMNDGRNFLGYGEQTADKLDWEINLTKTAGVRAPPGSSAPAPSGSRAIVIGLVCAALAFVILIVRAFRRRKYPS